VKLSFTDDALEMIAEYTAQANEKMEDIGARRLHTTLNTLLDEYLFDIPEKKIKTIVIERDFVKAKLQNIIDSEDLSKYIL
jgi:ATP-dependent HslUV protease ATP-binding subunit HslU